MAEYFFELLAEEIPAWMLDGALADLKTALESMAATTGAAEAAVTVNATPRRISFFLAGLPERQDDRVETVKGPSKKAAYDADGNPTQALAGFLRKNGAAVGDIIDAGDYVQVRKNVPGRETAAILAERVPQIVEGMRWPKTMRWGTGERAWIRPVHSIVSVYEGQHLPLSVFGIASGTTTVGHRTLAPGPIEVASYNEYVTRLELGRVVAGAVRRREIMAKRAMVLAKEANGQPSDDASIWSQWQYLTEYPGLVRAEFRAEYLALPEEVLVTVMRVHQKQIPIRDRDGKLTNSFLAVLDNEGDPEGHAAYGNSFVTNARFADARFFYDTDRRHPLVGRLAQLESLQFQEKLGNYRAKSERIETIAAGICAAAGIDPQEIVAAARISKCDLVTEMVKEFTDLQGQIGGIYAREEGAPEGVWQAVYDHYKPVSLDDALPRTISGSVLSLADRIDTLAGFFGIGAKPTGSRDPFGLRRAAQGVVQILLNRDRREVKIGIAALIDLAIASYGGNLAAGTREELLTFFAERVRTILEASAWKFAYDEVAAAMEGGWEASLTDLADRIAALKAVRDDQNFLSILDSARRIANITEGQENTALDSSKLEHPTESRLAELAAIVTSQITEMIAERRYRPALESFAAMAPELETFFKDVLVMVDDEAVRRNRIALLRQVGGAVSRIADVTKIVVDRRDYRP